jgi:hypothetical protein
MCDVLWKPDEVDHGRGSRENRKKLTRAPFSPRGAQKQIQTD